MFISLLCLKKEKKEDVLFFSFLWVIRHSGEQMDPEYKKINCLKKSLTCPDLLVFYLLYTFIKYSCCYKHNMDCWTHDQ